MQALYKLGKIASISIFDAGDLSICMKRSNRTKGKRSVHSLQAPAVTELSNQANNTFVYISDYTLCISLVVLDPTLQHLKAIYLLTACH